MRHRSLAMAPFLHTLPSLVDQGFGRRLAADLTISGACEAASIFLNAPLGTCRRTLFQQRMGGHPLSQVWGASSTPPVSFHMGHFIHTNGTSCKTERASGGNYYVWGASSTLLVSMYMLLSIQVKAVSLGSRRACTGTVSGALQAAKHLRVVRRAPAHRNKQRWGPAQQEGRTGVVGGALQAAEHLGAARRSQELEPPGVLALAARPGEQVVVRERPALDCAPAQHHRRAACVASETSMVTLLALLRRKMCTLLCATAQPLTARLPSTAAAPPLP